MMICGDRLPDDGQVLGLPTICCAEDKMTWRKSFAPNSPAEVGFRGAWVRGIMARLDGATGNLIWFNNYEVSVMGAISWGACRV